MFAQDEIDIDLPEDSSIDSKYIKENTVWLSLTNLTQSNCFIKVFHNRSYDDDGMIVTSSLTLSTRIEDRGTYRLRVNCSSDDRILMIVYNDPDASCSCTRIPHKRTKVWFDINEDTNVNITKGINHYIFSNINIEYRVTKCYDCWSWWWQVCGKPHDD